SQKSKKLKKLQTALERRQVKMADLATKDPQAFLNNAIPENVLARLPIEIQDKIEKKISVQGEIEGVHIDNTDESKTEDRYYLYNKSANKRYRIQSLEKNNLSSIGAGTVQVHAISAGVDATTGEDVLVLPYLDETNVQTVAVAPTNMEGGKVAGVSTEKNVVVMKINFADSLGIPYSDTDLSNVLINDTDSVKNYMLENSLGGVNVNATIVPETFTLTYPYISNQVCDLMGWADQADSMAKKAGIVFPSNVIKVYIFGYSPCGCSGAATIALGNGAMSTTPTRVWINDVQPKSVWDHEFGHTVGAEHSGSISCGGVALDPTYATCTVNTYGDKYDVMALANNVSPVNHMNVYHKNEIGIFDSTNIQTVTTSGTYTISPLETGSTGTKALKIYKSNTDDYYWVDFRKAFGFDANLPIAYTSGASLFIEDHDALNRLNLFGNPSLRIDLTPGDNTLSNAPFTDGQVFNDTVNGISIKQISHTLDSVTIEVNFYDAQSSCFRIAPTWTAVGSTPSFQNNDTTPCGTSSFSVSANAPSGWNVNFPNSNPSLTSGGNASLGMIQITPKSNTSDGVYPISVVVTNTADTSSSASYTYNYIVLEGSSSAVAPAVSFTSPANGATITSGTVSGGSVVSTGETVSVSVNVVSDSTIEKVEFYRDLLSDTFNPFMFNTDTVAPYSTSWDTSSMGAGSWILTAKAYDVYGNVGTAEISVTLSPVAINDSASPTVSIIVPVSGAIVSGYNTLIQAVATDNIKVAGVTFKVDGVAIGSEDTSYPYTKTFWDTTVYTPGSQHVLTAVARDNAGNSTVSAPVTFTVDDSGPTVTLTSPTANSVVQAGQIVTLGASVTGDNIKEVKFFRQAVGKTKFGLITDVKKPYQFDWNTTGFVSGDYVLSAIAYDVNGNASPEASVTISLNGVTAPTTPTPPATPTVPKGGSSAPTITLTSPTNGTVVTGLVTITANASDDVAISKVKFYKKFNDFATFGFGSDDTVAPYTTTLDMTTFASGTYVFTAEAYDGDGNMTKSQEVTVTK
ncbi:MAG: hypothetical protein KBB88_03430, partial [Candidatus Pacebacteria bacterium]|nr:hypothetical protein [Candidatus Paceibacterota bacterium]